MPTLDVDAVKAFVVISDLKSFTLAAEVLGTTQGMLSVKLKRLENKLGQRLIERTPRYVRLSTHGELFIGSARELLEVHERALKSLSSPRRRFKIGIACHVIGPEITALLTKLKLLAPTILIEVRLDSSRALLNAHDDGLLDAIIVRSEDDRRDGTILCPEHFGWYAGINFKSNSKAPLPLANLSPHCGMHNIAGQVLEQASIPWKEVFVSDGMQAIIAAISAGVAIGAFPCRLAPPEFIEVGSSLGLPSLPSSSIMLHSLLSDHMTRKILHIIADAFQEYHETKAIVSMR